MTQIRLRLYTAEASYRKPVGLRLRRYSEQAATPEWWKKLTKKAQRGSPVEHWTSNRPPLGSNPPRPDSSLCVVLMGLRIAEVHEHAVAHVLRHKAAEPLHGLSDALLVGGNNFAEVLWVHTRRERRRTDEVTEQDRNLAALGGVLRPIGTCSQLGNCCCRSALNAE